MTLFHQYFVKRNKRLSQSTLFIYICVLFIFSYNIIQADTYTSKQNGDWSNSSTWVGGVAPGDNLEDDIVYINHRVEHNASILIKSNAKLELNGILYISNGDFTIEETDCYFTIHYGTLLVPNGNCLNKKGKIELIEGGIQLCNGNYTDEATIAENGTYGSGYIYTKNGNIENKNAAPFSSSINWCSSTGGSLNMPVAENCALAEPPNQNCEDETFFFSFLPVELSHFEATTKDCITTLNWTSESEENFDYYEVQRCTDGINFISLNKIKGIGGSFSQNYQFSDRTAPLESYYRLKMIDLDGSFEFSDIIHSKTNCTESAEMLVFPTTLTQGNAILNVRINHTEGPSQLLIFNTIGSLIKRMEYNMLEKETQRLEFDVANLPRGKYFIKDNRSNMIRSFTIQ